MARGLLALKVFQGISLIQSLQPLRQAGKVLANKAKVSSESRDLDAWERSLSIYSATPADQSQWQAAWVRCPGQHVTNICLGKRFSHHCFSFIVFTSCFPKSHCNHFMCEVNNPFFPQRSFLNIK